MCLMQFHLDIQYAPKIYIFLYFFELKAPFDIYFHVPLIVLRINKHGCGDTTKILGAISAWLSVKTQEPEPFHLGSL